MTALTLDDTSRHDFKNQLAIIRGFSEILVAETAADDPRRRDLERIYEAAVHALELLAHMPPHAAGGSAGPEGSL